MGLGTLLVFPGIAKRLPHLEGDTKQDPHGRNMGIEAFKFDCDSILWLLRVCVHHEQGFDLCDDRICDTVRIRVLEVQEHLLVFPLVSIKVIFADFGTPLLDFFSGEEAVLFIILIHRHQIGASHVMPESFFELQAPTQIARRRRSDAPLMLRRLELELVAPHGVSLIQIGSVRGDSVLEPSSQDEFESLGRGLIEQGGGDWPFLVEGYKKPFGVVNLASKVFFYALLVKAAPAFLVVHVVPEESSSSS